MNKKLWVLGLTAAAFLTGAIILSVCNEKTKQRKRLAIISDAGYETAHDVHFPLEKRQHRLKGLFKKG
jgi:hypothetical protein